jgi:hypothetical protein
VEISKQCNDVENYLACIVLHRHGQFSFNLGLRRKKPTIRRIHPYIRRVSPVRVGPSLKVWFPTILSTNIGGRNMVWIHVTWILDYRGTVAFDISLRFSASFKMLAWNDSGFQFSCSTYPGEYDSSDHSSKPGLSRSNEIT